MRSTLCAAALLVPALVLAAPPWLLENRNLRLSLQPDGGFSIREKIYGTVWESRAPAASPVKLGAVAATGRALEADAEIQGTRWRLRLELAAAEPELELTLAAPAGAPLAHDIRYPLALKAPSTAYRIILPHKTGLWFGVEDADRFQRIAGRYPCFGPVGLSMPWFGLSDGRRGLFVLIETPADAGVEVQLASRVFAPQVYWQPTRGKAGYPRRLRMRLLSGGYVEMCKFYRRLLITRGEFVSLREKEQINPNVARLVGAIDLHLRGSADDQVECVKLLESRGVKRMLINSGAPPATLAWMRERGHLVGAYRIYTDIHPPRPGLPESLARGYPDHAYTLKDGSPVRGFAWSETRKTTYRCPLLQIPLMIDLVPPLLRENGYEALFLDVLTALSPQECYAPAHPLDRRADIEWRINVLRYAASLGLVIGSEDGDSWAAPHLDYFEGMTMPRRFGYVRGVSISNWPKPFEPNEEYIGITLNERVRVPLWDLVFHDSVVSAWRWNFTPDRYPDSRLWDKQDLLQMIAGNMPIFIADRAHLEKLGERIAESYKRCSEWNAWTGWDELVDHRLLTPDGSVQESRFSSGWAVIVNFSPDKLYKSRDGSVIGPMSYRRIRWR